MDRNLRIRMLLEAADKVSRPLREIAGNSTRAGRALKAARDRLKQLEAAQADVASFRALKSGLRTTEDQLAGARRRVAELARQMDAAGTPTRKLARDFDQAKRSAAALKLQHEQQSAELQQVRTRMVAAGISAGGLVAHERELRNAIARTNNELQEHARRLRAAEDRARRFAAGRAKFAAVQGTATGLAAGGFSAIQTGQAIGRPMLAQIRDAVNFESAMADVRKVVDGLEEPRAFAVMSNDILGLSRRLPMAAEGIAAIIAAGGQAGIARGELLGFAEDAAKMGVAFDVTADVAGETMAKWRTAFGFGREGVVRLADQVNYLGNTTAAAAPLITDIVTRIGPLGSVGGLASGEIAALGATLGGMGIESEIAATGIKNTMLALTKGAAATRKQREAFKALGLEATAVSKAMQRDAAGTIVDVMQRLGRLPKEGQSGLLTQIFGSESVAAIAPLLTQIDVLRENFAKVGERRPRRRR